jgi:DNA invertase Pin-like site-specific DNA recombinase
MKLVAYYRVSTKKQGRSGLGLDSQRAIVQAFGANHEIVAEFTEVESGRKSSRPQLQAALLECRHRGATLVVAKLDRLARNLHFLSTLMESGVEFIACDMPFANRMTIQNLAAVAEDEAQRYAVGLRTHGSSEKRGAGSSEALCPRPARKRINRQPPNSANRLAFPPASYATRDYRSFRLHTISTGRDFAPAKTKHSLRPQFGGF